LIAICGFDGSGKSTQVQRLADRVRATGREVVVTRQPTDWYRQDQLVRKVLADGGDRNEMRYLALLSAADRQRHILEVIDPALSRGATVISDRYIFSALALFQARGIDLEFVCAINAQIPRPDVTIFLDVAEDQLLDRIEKRGFGEIKFEETKENISRILSFYKTMWDEFIVVSGEMPIEDVSETIYSNVSKILESE
jgi:dTMP kinase